MISAYDGPLGTDCCIDVCLDCPTSVGWFLCAVGGFRGRPQRGGSATTAGWVSKEGGFQTVYEHVVELAPQSRFKVFFYASSVTPHIWPWFPNSCLYLILEVFDIDLCSMECYFPRSRARKVTFRALGRGEWLSMLWDLGFCKCQHSQFTYSLLIKRNLTTFERVPLSKPGFEPGTSRT